MCIAGANAANKQGTALSCSKHSANGSSSSLVPSSILGADGAPLEVPVRKAAMNGSLGFHTLGVDMPVLGNFTLTRVVGWKWDERFQAYTTEVRQ